MVWSWFMDSSSCKSFLQAYPELLLSLLSFLFLSLYIHVLRIPPAIPVNWPLIGMLPGIISRLNKIHDWSVQVYRELRTCTFWFRGPWFLGMDYLITLDPANVQHIFNTNHANYPKGEEFSAIFDVLGDSIINTDADEWRKQRTMAHTLLSSRRFRAFVADSTQRKVATSLLPFLDQIGSRGDAAVVDVQDVFLRLTFDTTSCFLFGVDPGCLSADLPVVPFAKAVDDAMGAVFFRHVMPPAFWKLMRWLGVGEERKLAAAWKEIDRFIAENIAEKKNRRNRDVSNNSNHDLLSSYIDYDVPNDDKFLRDTVITFMLAGRDTTGVALTWFFWLLSKNPAVEPKILEELMKVTPRRSSCSNQDLTVFDSEELGKLAYLHAALCESLRLFPSIPFEYKSALRADVLPSGDKVEAGAKILLSAYCMARVEEVWGKDCLEFRPERWISDKGTVRHEPSYKFLAFNSGPRTCLGKDVALTQMKAAAAAVVYNFHVEVVEGHVVEPKLSVILQMKNGLLARVRRRAAPE